MRKASECLAESRDALVAAVHGLTEGQFQFKQAPERWCIAEIIEHVALIEGRVVAIIERMKEMPDSSPESDKEEMDQRILNEIPKRLRKIQAPPPVIPTNGWTGEEGLAHFLECREHTSKLVSSPVLRGPLVPHPIFGPWDGYQWLLAAAAHSSRHIHQIMEVKTDPNFPSRG